MKQKTATKNEFNIPALADVSKKHGTGSELRAGLVTQLYDARQELIELGAAGVKSFGVNERKNNRVAKLLGDEVEGDVTTDLQRRKELEQLIVDLQSAIGVIDARLAVERANASRLICKQLEPAHKDLVKNMVAKMVELYALSVTYRQFKNEVEAKDIAWLGIQPVPLRFIGALSAFMRDGVDNGYIDKTSIPKELVN